MIIGLTGLKSSGKDTVAAYLIKEYGYERRAFADKLKQSAAALFGILPHEFEAMKNDPTAYVAIGFKTSDPGDHADISHMWSPSREMTVREMLQRYGTESHRDVFGHSFWVDQLIPLNGYYADRDIVITDMRFHSEAKRIKQLHGATVRVWRPHSEQDPHRSEVEQQSILVDYTLDNDGTLEDIPEKVDQMLKELKLERVGI